MGGGAWPVAGGEPCPCGCAGCDLLLSRRPCPHAPVPPRSKRLRLPPLGRRAPNPRCCRGQGNPQSRHRRPCWKRVRLRQRPRRRRWHVPAQDPWADIAWQRGLPADRQAAEKNLPLVAEHDKTKTAPDGEVIRQLFSVVQASSLHPNSNLRLIQCFCPPSTTSPPPPHSGRTAPRPPQKKCKYPVDICVAIIHINPMTVASVHASENDCKPPALNNRRLKWAPVRKCEQMCGKK